MFPDQRRVQVASTAAARWIKKKSTARGLCGYGGYTLSSVIEAPLITREVLPETYFLLVIMAADAQARPFLQFQASC
jgi:hypothetical protein